MNREEIKKAAEIMLAYANGKEIEWKEAEGNSNWKCCTDPCFDWFRHNYRIKSEPNYRPFKTQEECWQEMHKHPDFGWVKNKNSIPFYFKIIFVGYDIIKINDLNVNCEKCFNEFTFTDGEPFGIKEE